MTTTTQPYSGEQLTGQIHEVKKETVTANWETKSQRIADVITLITADGRDSYFIKLTLPEGWNAARYTPGSRWTFGIRSYVSKNGKVARALRTDLEPYPAESE